MRWFFLAGWVLACWAASCVCALAELALVCDCRTAILCASIMMTPRSLPQQRRGAAQKGWQFVYVCAFRAVPEAWLLWLESMWMTVMAVHGHGSVCLRGFQAVTPHCCMIVGSETLQHLQPGNPAPNTDQQHVSHSRYSSAAPSSGSTYIVWCFAAPSCTWKLYTRGRYNCTTCTDTTCRVFCCSIVRGHTSVAALKHSSLPLISWQLAHSRNTLYTSSTHLLHVKLLHVKLEAENTPRLCNLHKSKNTPKKRHHFLPALRTSHITAAV